MCSAEPLREFIRERLTAAAEEIFSEVHKTIVRYEEELRLMGIFWKPQIKLSRTGPELMRESSDLQKSHVSVEVSVSQQLCEQRRRSRQDQEEPEPLIEQQSHAGSPWVKAEEDIEHVLVQRHKESGTNWAKEEPPLIKEEDEPEPLPTTLDQRNIYSSQGEEQQVQNRSVDLIQTSTLQERVLGEGEPETEQLSFHIFDIVESKDVDRSSSTASERRYETKERPLTCDICGRSFRSKNNFDLHSQTHTGVRPFPCETCGKRFSRFDHLKLHRMIHTGEKPFSCDTCGKSFCRMDYLSAHKKIHTGVRPFQCQTCGRAFTIRNTLNAHQRTHTGERPFPCLVCGKTFIENRKRNFHMKHKHKSETALDSQTDVSL